MLESLRRRRQRALDDYSKPFFDAIFEGVSADTQKPEGSGRLVITFGLLVHRYMADPSRGHLTEKSRISDKAKFRALKELIGAEKSVRDITREDCRQVRGALLSLPTNARKRFPEFSLNQAAERAEKKNLPKMSAKTVNSYLNSLSALFKYAVREEYMDANPAEALRVKGAISNKDSRNPFSLAQLKAIFGAPLYTGCKNDGPGYSEPGPKVVRRGRLWVPLIALFTGMRLNEICQLGVSDVAKKNGVDVIFVRAESVDDGGTDKRLKTAAATRFIPIHPELRKIGFLKYVQAMRKTKDSRLFPELTKGATGYYSDPFEKWFSRFLNKADAKTSRTSFHSFRHNFRDALREADVNRDAVRALGGWAGNGGAEEIYGGGLKASTLAREIKKVKYPKLNLSYLYVN